MFKDGPWASWWQHSPLELHPWRAAVPTPALSGGAAGEPLSQGYVPPWSWRDPWQELPAAVVFNVSSITAGGPGAMLEPLPSTPWWGGVALRCLSRTTVKVGSVFLRWWSCPTISSAASPPCPDTWNGGRLQVSFRFLFASLLSVLTASPKLLCEARPTIGLTLAPAFSPAFLLQLPPKVLESPRSVPSERPEPAQRQN